MMFAEIELLRKSNHEVMIHYEDSWALCFLRSVDIEPGIVLSCACNCPIGHPVLPWQLSSVKACGVPKVFTLSNVVVFPSMTESLKVKSPLDQKMLVIFHRRCG